MIGRQQSSDRHAEKEREPRQFLKNSTCSLQSCLSDSPTWAMTMMSSLITMAAKITAEKVDSRQLFSSEGEPSNLAFSEYCFFELLGFLCDRKEP
jgi:hypothetical protein